MIAIAAALLAHVALSGIAPPAQTGLVVGRVTDAGTGAPLPDAEVRLAGTSGVVRTDSAGRFRIAAAGSGARALVALRVGYRPDTSAVTVVGDSTVVAVALRAVVTQLAAVRVEESKPTFRLAEFEDRRRNRRGGYYISGDDLRRYEGRELGDVLRSVVPAVTVQRAPDGSQFLANRREPTRMRTVNQLERGERGRQSVMQIVKNAPCVPRIFLDGLSFNDSTVSVFSVGDLAGVEFHDVSTMPVQYRRTGTECGALLLWSR